jgi:cysteine desulfurase/selenocysteine lyase
MSMSESALGPGSAGAAVPGENLAAHAGPAAPGAAPRAVPEVGQTLGRMIERLANEYFSGVPGPAIELGRHAAPAPLALSGAPAPGPVALPSGVFPAATSLGAGGGSPAAGWVPPTPGVLQAPPIASGPLPKESDLRTLPAMLSEGLGISSPVGLAGGLEPSIESAPYFLELAAPGPAFGAAPGVASPALSRVNAGAPSVSPMAPPAHGLPAAASVGAGGVSPGAGWVPPTPGVVQQVPLASRPSPKEGDLLSAPATFSDGLAGNAVPGADSAPYFLSMAGLPRAQPSAGGVPGIPAPNGRAPNTPGAVDKHAVPVDAALTSRAGHSPFVPAGGAPRGGESARPATATGGSTPGGSLYSPSELSLLPYAFDTHRASPRMDPKSGRRLFDPVSVRNDFPILKERVNGRELVWFDNAATTQKPRAVIERLSYFYEHENSNIHRAAHTLAARATDAYEGARETVRRFINAPSVSEIIFARGTTEAINLVAKSWGGRFLERGDEVVITWLEHHANIVPWQQICNERGARLKVAPVDDDGQVLLYEYEKLLGSRTKFVSLSHVSNALGTIVPVTEMVEMAHRQGATVLVDGAQAVSHMPVDVQGIGCDFYVFSGHKIFGPTGIGALFGKAAVLDSMPPWQGGGNMIRDVTFEKTQFQGPPARFEAGTPNIADAVGLGAALDYVTSLGIENISRYEHELLVYATERLTRISGLRLYGTAPDKAGVLSFTIEGLKTEDIGVALDREGIAVRAGHHCAQPILRRFGQETTVRASLAPYNTYDDVDALVAALQRLRVMRS